MAALESRVDQTACRPVVAGTDIKVSQIAREFERMGMTPNEIVEAHPHLSLADVQAALAYYYAHIEAIHEEWRRTDLLVEALRRRFPGSNLAR